jgi:5-(hydroxymethyl)furfural/furfural oxidase
LRIATDTHVTGLLLTGRRVTGVEVRRSDNTVEKWSAGETILAAGALQTPALLMRAGIGPAAHLRERGVAVVADRPGVGRNLQNHPFLPSFAILSVSGADRVLGRPPAGTFLRWSSGLPGTGRGDMGLYVRSYIAWHAVGRRIAMLGPVLLKPGSAGEVRLAGRSPDTPPVVAFNFLDDARDLQRVMAGYRRAAGIFATAELRALCGPAFALTDAARLGRYNNLSARNAAFAWIGARVFDISARAGMRLLGTLAHVRPLQDFINDDAALAEFVTGNISGTYHVCGTCRMGRIGDPMAVVGPSGAAYGLQGLRVADASVMPSVPSGNTHIPTVMVAEKIAAAIQAGE